MLDLDLLRNINNTYGHLAGDEVLIEISRILKNSVREYDVVARFGGEEFSIMLPETTIQQAYERSEIIRHAIEWTEFNIPTSVTPIKVTISLGIAERESFAQTAEEIIHNADAALYHSKLNGRNKSSAYRDSAYINLIGRDRKVEPLVTNQIKNKSQQEPVTNTENNYAAANSKYIKTQPIPKFYGVSATDEKKSKTVPLKPAKRFQPVYLYIGGMAALAIALSIGLFNYEPLLYQINWMQILPGLLTCVLFVILTELFSIDLYMGKASISTSAVPLLAGAILFGPAAGIILSAIFSIIVGIKYRSKGDKFIFNFSNQAIAVILYTFILHFLAPSLENYSIGIQAIFVVLAALLVYITTTWLISVGMGIDLKQWPGHIWKEQYAWLVTIYIGIGLVATAYIFGYRAQGVLGAFMMMGPLLLLRISQKQYVDRTREAVTELRGKNNTLEKTAEAINQLNNGLLETLAEIIDLRDPYVLGHSKRVSNFATLIAKKMGLKAKQVELVRTGSLLHDIGKLGISADILAKTTRLSNQEYEVIKQHPGIGTRILEKNPSLRQLIPIVLHHHEFYDGQGYPDGISGNQIPIEARIVSIADAIEAMEADRPYREANNIQYIIDEIKKFSGTQFDPKVVEEAVKLLESGELSKAALARDKKLFSVQDIENRKS
jgi:diguanylate cyclase (GGDEF)-like protein/putative nucleotidyltransferase with HDIG domain